eukprot:scaffold498569_cov23-Prasinocladus_malaysianus.AAC.2
MLKAYPLVARISPFTLLVPSAVQHCDEHFPVWPAACPQSRIKKQIGYNRGMLLANNDAIVEASIYGVIQISRGVQSNA